MIVTLYDDQAVQKVAEMLSAEHPNELSCSMEYFLMAIEENALLEKDDSLPVRISFISHCGFNMTFWGQSALEFSDNIKNELRKYARLNPLIMQTLMDIDLIGCRAGFVNKKDACVADIFANAMQQLRLDGFKQIQVRAFTNLSHSDPYSTKALLVGVVKQNTFKCLLIKTQQDLKIFASKIQHINELLSDLNEENSQFTLVAVKELRKEAGELTVSVVETQDIRLALDTRSECNFTQHMLDLRNKVKRSTSLQRVSVFNRGQKEESSGEVSHRQRYASNVQ